VPSDYGLGTMERTNIDFWITAFWFAPAIILGFCLTKAFGAIGAAYGLLTFNGITLIARYILFIRKARLEQTKWIP
jgi:O-antigen/teichoic acid export membrane protein